MPAGATFSQLSPSQLLHVSQSTGPNASAAQDCIVEVFGGDLQRLAARTCRRYCLPDQEREDVLAETYRQLLSPQIVRFVPGRGKPGHYFKGLVQNAARRQLAQFGARRSKGASGIDSARPPSATCEVARYRLPLAASSPADNAELHDTAKFILEQATPRVRKALELLYWDNWSLQEVAAQLGVNRFSLKREIRAFFNRMNSQLGDGLPAAARRLYGTN